MTEEDKDNIHELLVGNRNERIANNYCNEDKYILVSFIGSFRVHLFARQER